MVGKSIGIITFPINKNGIVPLSNLVDIITFIRPKIYLITGDEGYTHFQNDNRLTIFNVTYANSRFKLFKIFRYFMIQLQMTRIVLATRKEVSIWFFFIGGSSLIMPNMVAKLAGKKTCIILAGSEKKGADIAYPKFPSPQKLLIDVGYAITDHAIIYSETLIHTWNLNKLQEKTIVAHRHFLDLNSYNNTIPLDARPLLIGYVGSLGEVKGVLNFSRALPEILENMKECRVLIGGDGSLKGKIVTTLQEESLIDRVEMPGWIPHDELPKYLNRLRLLVIPSYSEGLPNIMIEALACGTPVLATPVGAVPDVIMDGRTGFILKDNSPECIAEGVIRALKSPELGPIAENGRRLVEENFTFERVVARWKEVLEEISYDIE